MIPDHDTDTGNLPPGVHEVTWQEMSARFGFTAHRLQLLEGLKQVLLSLQNAGCRRAYVNGSFVTTKEHPNDFDGCWEMDGVDIDRLESIAPALLDFEERRRAQKAAFGGEMFPARWGADSSGTAFLDFFQRDKYTGARKGIIAIDLKDFP